jgi:hypothetical protein
VSRAGLEPATQVLQTTGRTPWPDASRRHRTAARRSPAPPRWRGRPGHDLGPVAPRVPYMGRLAPPYGAKGARQSRASSLDVRLDLTRFILDRTTTLVVEVGQPISLWKALTGFVVPPVHHEVVDVAVLHEQDQLIHPAIVDVR